MKKIACNRPVISILIVYVFLLIILNCLGIFSSQKNSSLINNTNKYTTELTGKVITEPIQKNDKQQFVLEVFDIGGQKIKKEKTLVYASAAYNIEYGDVVFVSGKLSPPPFAKRKTYQHSTLLSYISTIITQSKSQFGGKNGGF